MDNNKIEHLSKVCLKLLISILEITIFHSKLEVSDLSGLDLGYSGFSGFSRSEKSANLNPDFFGFDPLLEILKFS